VDFVVLLGIWLVIWLGIWLGVVVIWLGVLGIWLDVVPDGVVCHFLCDVFV
jgi:hypothetical protein